ncbi:MAG: P-loop NTPase [Chlamydiales bacterium]|nr:P-loop NTPase [Chlamydiales bacterium]
MTNRTSKQEPLILGIGGGKGGVGKSMVSSNLAVQYAMGGLRVIVIDLDFGAANLHTIFGVRQPAKSLGDYFYSPRSQLSDYFVKTSLDNLTLVPSSGFVPELANLKHMQRVKLINHIKTLDADLVILDLGAGSSLNVVDFFSMCHAGVVVATPEPTAVLNAYEFLKNVLYRILFRMLRNDKALTDLLKASTRNNNELGIHTVSDLINAIAKVNRFAAETIQEVCQDLSFHLIFNQARKTSDVQLGRKLNQICEKYLNVNLNFSGIIFYNEEVPACVYKMCPISIAAPESVTSQTLRNIAVTTFNRVAHAVAGEPLPDDFDAQIDNVGKHARVDFERNLLTQRRLQRSKERAFLGSESTDLVALEEG